jgi:hypothetical protein
MKKLIAVLVLMLCCTVARAELNIGEIIKKIPDWKQGISYSLIDHDFNYLSTLEVANWKGITVEAGYNSENAVVGVVSYQLLKLKDLGVNVPVLDLLECNLGGYVGYKRIEIKSLDDAEFDFGVSVTLISLHF